jgi:flagellar biosynthesis protein FlhF
MRIKRYFGKTIRQAIQKVREEQGPDAVILSNRKVDGGVEIVAAIDFDEVLLDPDAFAARSGSAVEPPPRVVVPRPYVAAGAFGAARAATTATVAPGSRPAVQAAGGARGQAAGAGAVGAGANTATRAPDAYGAAGTARAEQALAEMRRELAGMRGLLEQQLAGLIWGEVARRNPMQANLLRMLLKLDLSPRLCEQLAAELPAAAADAQKAWRSALANLAHKLAVTDDDILTRGGVVALLGPTGVGKTTTVAKLAARFCVRHGARRVALVTTDHYRIGAHEQLRAYAKLLDVPLRVAASAEELRAVLQDLSDRQLVLIDTAGMSQRDLRLSEQFALIRAGQHPIKCYLVLAATTQAAGIAEILRAYAPLEPTACIITKVDEAVSLGGILSRLVQQRLPVAYLSDGQRVPEDLYAARAHQLVSRCVALMRRAQAADAEGERAFAAALTAAEVAHAC